MVDPLRFALGLAADPLARDRFRAAPHDVLAAEVDDAATLTGEDVVAVAEVLRQRLPPRDAALVAVPEPARPEGDETPLDAAVRLLVGLCDVLDGPAVAPMTLPHRELRPDPPPAQTARGGGAPVPTEPPGGRWLHPVIPDDDGPRP